MKLLIVTQAVDTEDPFLGFFIRWIEEFSKRVEHVEVICLKLGEFNSPKNVRVHSLGKPSSVKATDGARARFLSRIRYAARFLWLAWRLRRDYDAVFVHMNPEYLVIAGWLWRLLGKRTVLWYTHKSVDLKLRVAVAFASAVCTASPESFRLATPKLHVIGHGIDVGQFAAVSHQGHDPQTPLRIVNIGRVTPIKGLHVLVEAMAILRDRRVDAEVTFVGAPATPADYAYQATLMRLIEENDLGDRVRFAGNVPHALIPAQYGAHDVSTNLTPTGGMDKVVLESLIAGVPAVTTNEAFRALLAPVGLFVKPPTPEAVADALVRAAEVDIGPITREVRERYSLPRLVGTILSVLSA